MREVLANSRPDGKRILDRRIDVRRSFDVFEFFVNQEGRLFDESRNRAIAAAAGRFDEFVQLRHMRDVSRRNDEVEKFFLQLLAVIFQFGEFHSARWQRGHVVRQDNGLRFDLQVVVLGKNVELMNPIPERIAIGSAARNRIGEKAERQAALRFVVDRPQADFVVAFRNRAVVPKFRGVHEMISVHATTA